jgi:uncharacterized protein YjbJ (UPF0337 family)
MGKAKGKAKQMKGKMKETTGKTMGDTTMEREGRSEQMPGKTQDQGMRPSERPKKTPR